MVVFVIFIPLLKVPVEGKELERQRQVDNVDWNELMIIMNVYLCKGEDVWVDHTQEERTKHLLRILHLMTCTLKIAPATYRHLREYFIFMVSGTPYRRSCFRQAFISEISRLFSCREILPLIISLLKTSYVNLNCSKNSTRGLCVFVGYLKRSDILSNIHDILFTLSIYKTCQRIPFRRQLAQFLQSSNKSLSDTSEKRRKKRFYDINALMYILGDVMSLSISDIDLGSQNSSAPGDQLKRSFFLYEGFLYCTLKS